MFGNGSLSRSGITGKHHVHGRHLVEDALAGPQIVHLHQGCMIQDLLFHVLQTRHGIQFTDCLLRIGLFYLGQILGHNGHLVGRQLLLIYPFGHSGNNLHIQQLPQEVFIPEIRAAQLIRIAQIVLQRLLRRRIQHIVLTVDVIRHDLHHGLRSQVLKLEDIGKPVPGFLYASYQLRQSGRPS